MAKLISKVYGDALFETALESGRFDDFFEEAKVLVKVLEENEDLSLLLNHPKVSQDEKMEVLEDCFKEYVSKEMLGLLKLVVTKDRFSSMKDILENFLSQVKEYKNIGNILYLEKKTLLLRSEYKNRHIASCDQATV